MMENTEKLKQQLKSVKVQTLNPFFNFFYWRFILREKSLLFKILPILLLPFSLIYLFIVTFKEKLTLPEEYSFPVISVGNITSGGTGKTPLVIYLSEKFKLKNLDVVILSSAASKSTKKRFRIEGDDELRMLKEKRFKPMIIPKQKKVLRELERKRSKNIKCRYRFKL